MIQPLPAPRPGQRISSRHYRAVSRSGAIKRITCFVFAAFSSGLFFFSVNVGQARLEDFLYAQITEPLNSIVYATPAPKAAAKPELAARAAISYRIGATGRERMIYEKGLDDVLPIASLTKLMTAVVALESSEIYGLERQVFINYGAASQDDVPIFGNLNCGEVYSVRQLLNLMLYYSSNDAAASLAQIAGEENFVAAMNRKAADIGLEKTVFYNPHGLDLDNGKANASSAGDLLLLVKYIMEKHPEILKFSTQPGPYLTENGIFNLKLSRDQSLIGGKTGYTIKAGGCMVFVFENEKKRRYINILLGAVSPEGRVAEMQKLLNYANNQVI